MPDSYCGLMTNKVEPEESRATGSDLNSRSEDKNQDLRKGNKDLNCRAEVLPLIFPKYLNEHFQSS